MKNYKMIVSYDGTRYYGWEHQPNTDMTIQGKLENVLTQMLETTSGKRPEKPVTVIKSHDGECPFGNRAFGE